MTDYFSYILMDNFRGFNRAVVPLTGTNFAVGENSSGKSSVLSLVKIITDINFWLRQDFKSDDVSFSHFSDMVSANATNGSYFRIGYLPKDFSGDKLSFYTAGFLGTFVNNNGVPNLKRFSAIFGEVTLHVKFSPNFFEYRIEKNQFGLTSSIEVAKNIFEHFIKIHESARGFKRLQAPQNYLSLMFAIQAIFQAEAQKGRDSLPPFSMPQLFPSHTPIWLSPIRSKPKRTYDDPINTFSPEGDHTPYLIRSMINNTKKRDFIDQLNQVGQKTGLFKEVTLTRYGRNKNAPFELDVVLDDVPLNVVNVGYGVSQSMPIIAEIIFRTTPSWFIVQQPEVHLHPRAQAVIGEVIFESALTKKNFSLIETHSDYLIDRFRLSIKKTRDTLIASESQVLFFLRQNGENKVIPISIDENGELSEDQPEEYRQFFINEQLKLLES